MKLFSAAVLCLLASVANAQTGVMPGGSNGSAGGAAAWGSITGMPADFQDGIDNTGGTPSFSAITGATNSTAAMVVGTGASLAASGSGTIIATTATALAANPTETNCATAGFTPRSIDASGNLTCAALTNADISALTASQAAVALVAAAIASPPVMCSVGSFTRGINTLGDSQSCTDAYTQAEADAAATAYMTLSGVQSVVTGTKTVTSKFDFGGGKLELPNGPVRPATCTAGEAFMDTTGISGSQHYLCETTNNWVLEGVPGSGDLEKSGTYAATQILTAVGTGTTVQASAATVSTVGDTITLVDPGNAQRGIEVPDNSAACRDPVSGATQLCPIGGFWYSKDTGTTSLKMPQVASLASDSSTTSVTPASITDLAFGVAANTTYSFRCELVSDGTTTSAPQYQFTGPASPTDFRATVTSFRASSTVATFESIAALSTLSTACTASCLATGTRPVWTVAGVLQNGANAGTLQLQLASSTAGQAVFTRKGSTCTFF